MTSDFIGYGREAVNRFLDNSFEEYYREASSVHNVLADLVSACRDYTLRGGKRLRALLILLGYWSREWGLDVEPIKPIMAAIEFLQSYLLVHDDIMDRDELRRGGPTLHVWYSRKCLEEELLGDCSHYGVSQAIVAGDYLEALAIASFTRARLPSDRIVRIIERYSRGLREVAYGQFLDVYYAYKPLRHVREEDVLKIHELKTASYTVELPLHLGAIASGEGEELLSLYTRYSRPAGIAFQLRDDIIGLYGDPRVTGKPMGSDVREKKKTLLIIKAYELASSDDKRFLEEIYDKRRPEDISDEDIERVQDIVRETGSLDYSEELIKKLYNEAIEIINNTNSICKETKRYLIEITSKLTYRNK